MRKRRFGAGLIGAVIGWGIAGLDGGFAETVDVPTPQADFVASGTVTSSRFGTMPFDLSRSDHRVHQVLVVANDRIEMIFDRHGEWVAVIDFGKTSVLPSGGATASLLHPFSRAERIADGPLRIERDGVDSHLGLPCERYRAFGTSNGAPLRATACVTAEGIPLISAISSAELTLRMQITDIEFSAPAPAVVDHRGGPLQDDVTGG